MALHGLAYVTIGVPNPDANRAFYREFGLREGSPGVFSTKEGGQQLRLADAPVRRLAEVAIAATDADDLERVRRAATAAGHEYHDEGEDVVVSEPIVNLPLRVTVRPQLRLAPTTPNAFNLPGVTNRGSERSPAITCDEPVQPRRLGHVIYTTPDLDASSRFLQEILGFKLTDRVPDVIEFLRCSQDHHNIGLINAPVPYFHHSSWQVDDVDQVGHAATRLIAVDPDRHVWGLGRHFLGSNFFWYLRDPAGNFAEYFADLDQIATDADWLARTWDPERALYAWGPPVPAHFLNPIDLDELSAAYASAR